MNPTPDAPRSTLPAPRSTMSGKPVFIVPTTQIINFESGFKEKLLCDGPTFSAGTACVYKCAFCYVPAVFAKQKPWLQKHGVEGKHEDVVIRRENPVEIVRRQLTDSKGRAKFADRSQDGRVIYSSPAVDVAANMDLVRETIEICKVILELTNWHIRLLSKSNLLPKVAETLHALCSDAQSRVIFGVSTGTLDDKLAGAIEELTPKVSKRIESLHWLQDNGFRTFGMICPSLPQDDYNTFAKEMAEAIRIDRCEHVWAEVINLRGESFTRTLKSLFDAGFEKEAGALDCVSRSSSLWEAYARETFNAHAAQFGTTSRHSITPTPHSHKLRFLQYVTPHSIDYWRPMQTYGAVLLGKAAHVSS